MIQMIVLAVIFCISDMHSSPKSVGPLSDWVRMHYRYHGWFIYVFVPTTVITKVSGQYNNFIISFQLFES